ncbi:MAG: hypothetical protein HW391_1994 [Chloroflexi bacterium]|nr:hypothetical protein [Chloroflexota bacterium]
MTSIAVLAGIAAPPAPLAGGDRMLREEPRPVRPMTPEASAT